MGLPWISQLLKYQLSAGDVIFQSYTHLRIYNEMQWIYCWVTYLSPSMSGLIMMVLLAVVDVGRNRFWGKFSSLVIGMGTGVGGSTVTVRLSLRLGGQGGPWWLALKGDSSGRDLRSSQRPEGKSSELAQARDKPGMFLIIFPLYKEILYLSIYMGFPGVSDTKESACNAADLSSIPQLGRSLGRAWQPTPVFLSGEFPQTEEPGRLQSMGSQRVGHDGSD